MSALSYQLASWPDEDAIVGEILLGQEHVATVFRRGEKFELTIYRQDPDPLTVNMDTLQNILVEIRGRLPG